MRSQISKPMPLRNWLSTNRDPFKYSLFSTRSARGFQAFHSELSVVWAKGSLVANKIESKSYYSPLILHSVRVLQKYAFEYTKKTSVSLRRFFWVPTKHCILRNIPYIRNPMFHRFYSAYADASMYQDSGCRGFITLLLQRSSANMSKLLLLLRWWDVCETGRQFPIISVAEEGRGEMCFPAGLHYPFILPFGKVCIAYMAI